jgi:hypothetical protein
MQSCSIHNQYCYVEGKAETNRIENYTFVATEKILSELGSVHIS